MALVVSGFHMPPGVIEEGDMRRMLLNTSLPLPPALSAMVSGDMGQTWQAATVQQNAPGFFGLSGTGQYLLCYLALGRS